MWYEIVVVLVLLDCFFIVVLGYVLVYVFFFFKQKTAYEMRISDWSSDVCSSDLGCRARDLAAVQRGSDGAATGDPPRRCRQAGGLVHAHARDPEIGRASCRERVCPYV